MRFTNQSGFPAAWTMGFERDGREMLIVIVKATYDLPVQGAQPQLAKEHVPLVEADQFTGEPGFSAPSYETDYAHRKLACDVLLLGSAYAPPGRQVTRTSVGLKVGLMVKQFNVVGQRHWQNRLVAVLASDPQPFTVMPITYDCAFGGTDRTEESKGLTDSFLANPVGKGFRKHTDAIDGEPLPNTEQPGQSVDSYNGKYLPMAFSPIGRNWTPRLSYVGTYDQQWIENIAPLWPADFDYRYFQAAPPDQVIPYPTGGEDIALKNLTADGQRAFKLPTHKMPVTFIPYKGKDVTLEANIDTIVIEPDLDRFTLTWRANLPLGKSIFDVKETIAGQMSAAWHRARRFPHKTYYPSLGQLVAEKRGRK